MSDLICDDCREPYDPPVYYTFETCLYESFPTALTSAGREHPYCTGILCPRCAGTYLEPDDPDDPRRPLVDVTF